MSDPQLLLGDYLKAARILPTVTLRSATEATALGELLAAAGYPAVEILLRDPQAWRAVEILRKAFPSLVIGMGTLKQEEDLRRAQDLGLNFGVSPGFRSELYRLACSLAFPYLPAFSTASELMQIEAAGAKCAKFFPAEALGPRYLAQLMAAFPSISVLPSGGLQELDIQAFQKLPYVTCLSGSWMLKDWQATLKPRNDLVHSLKALRSQGIS